MGFADRYRSSDASGSPAVTANLSPQRSRPASSLGLSVGRGNSESPPPAERMFESSAQPPLEEVEEQSASGAVGPVSNDEDEAMVRRKRLKQEELLNFANGTLKEVGLPESTLDSFVVVSLHGR